MSDSPAGEGIIVAPTRESFEADSALLPDGVLPLSHDE